MRRADLRWVPRVLASAFHDDPWIQWMFPDEAARPALAGAWMRGAAEASLSAGHGYVLAGQGGAALWGPPDVEFFPAASFKPLWSLVLGANPHRVDELREGLTAIGALHPDEGAFYLNAIGVDPSARGAGLGAQLLERVIGVCDHEGIPAYLESSNGRNVSLYERHGFEVTDELVIPDGPTMRPMWRDPR